MQRFTDDVAPGAEVVRLSCVQCGAAFEVDDPRWYASRGWAVPKRCERCRASRRIERALAARQQGADGA